MQLSAVHSSTLQRVMPRYHQHAVSTEMEATRIFSDNDATDMQTHGEVEGSYAPVYAIYAGNSAAATSTTLTMDEQNDYVVDTTSKLTATGHKHRVGGGVGVLALSLYVPGYRSSTCSQ